MKITKFQVIVLIIFLGFIVAGVTMFATYKGGGGSQPLPQVTVWGTFPKDKFDKYVAKVNESLSQQITVRYTEHTPTEFLGNFIAALARGTGPDAILVSADMLLPSQDKLTVIPYDVYPQRTFIDSFIDEARVYLSSDGILGVPFIVDPLVMYWNRDIFNVSGVAEPPKYWDQFADLNKKMTKKDGNGNLIRSAIALGEFSNIVNAREILGTLILQNGNPVTSYDRNGFITSTLRPNHPMSPVPAVTFFTQFADPNSDNYSWNKSFSDSKTSFISGKLATYFGFASEVFNIRDKNPNLNYDISSIPQVRNGNYTSTYGKLYGFSIVKQSRLQGAMMQIIYTLTGANNISNIASDMYLPSVSRSVVARGSRDPYITVFNEQALISKTWLDSDPSESRSVFSNMIQAITSGQRSIYQAVNDAGEAHDVALKRALGN